MVKNPENDDVEHDGHLVPASRRPRPISLSEESSLVGDLLSVPLYVQSPVVNRENRLAKGEDELAYSWLEKGVERTYVFTRPQYVPFPLPEHGELFFTLLAMFAARFNRDGKVYFRIIDIIKNAGKNPKSNSNYERVREMVWRYWQCTVTWDLGWKVKNFTYDEPQVDDPRSWRGQLITEQSMFTAKASMINNRKYAEKTSDPNRLTNAYQWHSVVLNPKVVQAVEERFIRKFLTHTLQSNLNDKSKGVYRYFFKFSDRSAVERSYDTLMQAFAWFGRKSRFIVWIHSCLEELKLHGAVEYYREVVAGQAIAVKCAPVEALKNDLCDSVDVSAKPLAASNLQQFPAKRGRRNADCESFLSAMDGPSLVRFANTLHSAALLTAEDFQNLNMIKERVGERQMVESLSNYLRRSWSKIGRQVKSLVKDAKQSALKDKSKASAAKRPGATAKVATKLKNESRLLFVDEPESVFAPQTTEPLKKTMAVIQPDLPIRRSGATSGQSGRDAENDLADIFKIFNSARGLPDGMSEDLLKKAEDAIKRMRQQKEELKSKPASKEP